MLHTPVGSPAAAVADMQLAYPRLCMGAKRATKPTRGFFLNPRDWFVKGTALRA